MDTQSSKKVMEEIIPVGLHAWKNDRLEEGRSLTNVAEEYGINQKVVSRAWKAFQTIGTAVKKVGGGHPRKTTLVDPAGKKGRYQSANAIPQQQSAKCRGLLWSDTFTKMAYSSFVLNAASLKKFVIGGTV
ncbi:uncharacterized protein TNCV_3971301 [Trichonephila clavipes]|nr:uncharacterized protein TNCV_3971301 [Trichonephila clavipes]